MCLLFCQVENVRFYVIYLHRTHDRENIVAHISKDLSTHEQQYLNKVLLSRLNLKNQLIAQSWLYHVTSVGMSCVVIIIIYIFQVQYHMYPFNKTFIVN